MLFNERINLFTTMSIISNLDMVAMVTKMNAGPLARVISMNVEDLCVAQCDTLRRLFANLADKSGSRQKRPTNSKGFLGEAIKFRIIKSQRPTRALKVIALWILAL